MESKSAAVRFSIKKIHNTKHENDSNYKLLDGDELTTVDVVETDASLGVTLSTENLNDALKQKKTITKSHRWKGVVNKAVLFMLASVIVTIVVLVWYFSHIMPDIYIKNGGRTVATFNIKSRLLTVYNQGTAVAQLFVDSEHRVAGTLMELQPCPGSHDNLCLKWALKNSSISITPQQFGEKDKSKLDCLKVEWRTSVNYAPTDCVNLTFTDSIWFDTHQYIASNFSDCAGDCMQYIPGGVSTIGPLGDVGLNRGGSVIEPLWLSSTGVAVKASTHHNLYVCKKHCKEQSQLCFRSLPHSPQPASQQQSFHLDYMVCAGGNLPVVHREIVKNFLKPLKYGSVPERYDDMVNDGVFYEDALSGVLTKNLPLTNTVLTEQCKDLISKPVWEVVVHGGLTNAAVTSQIMADLEGIGGTVQFTDTQQLFGKLGDYRIANSTVFKTLHRGNFKVLLPVTPFVNYDSVNFDTGVKHKYLMTGKEGAPSLTKLSIDGTVYFPCVIDFTNVNATQWFVKNAQGLAANGVDSVHLQYGQATWLPADYNLAHALHNPGHFSTLYTGTAYQLGRCSLTDVAYDSQRRNQFVVLSPAKGMRETLKAVLGAALAGYPFVVPDFPCTLEMASMVMRRGVLLEGMVRWLQMAAFFPVMHLPWDGDTLSAAAVDKLLLLEIAKKYVELRNSDEVYPRLERAMSDAETNLASSVIAPMWMAGSKEASIYSIADQFMVGTDLFVAPIMDMGVTSRDVYFPPGRWKDVVQGAVFHTEFGEWVQNYNASLREIPAFVRV